MNQASRQALVVGDLLAGEAADISLAFQDFEDVGSHLRGRRGDDGMARPLPVADPGQHVAERVGHHGSPPFTSSI